MSIIYHIFFRFFNRKTKKKISKHYQSQIAELGIILEDEDLSFIFVTHIICKLRLKSMTCPKTCRIEFNTFCVIGYVWYEPELQIPAFLIIYLQVNVFYYK